MENVVKKYNLPFEPSDSHKCEVPSCTFTGMSANSLMTHYYQCHRNDNNFQSSCVFSKRCFHETKFKSYSALKSHTVRFHPSFSLKKTQLTGDVDNVNYNEEILQDDVQQQSISDFMGVNLRLLSRDEDNNDFSKKNNHWPAQFVLSLMAERKFTQVDMKCIMEGVDSLVKKCVTEALDNTAEMLSERLQSSTSEETSFTTVSTVLKEVKDKFAMAKLFDGLETQHTQVKYFTNHFGLVMPKKVPLPLRLEDLGRGRNGKQTFKQQNYSYVSLLQQLETLLNIDDVCNEVLAEKTKVKGTFTSYEDGNYYKNSPLFTLHPRALQIHIYVDEVQMCCPLGSYNHKVVFVYFSLGNIQPKLRSTLKCINLLSIFYYDQVQQYGYNTMLKPIIEDLHLLEKGVTLNIKGKFEIFYGTLTGIVADNLASHQVGGFKSGFSRGFRKCRTCISLDHDIQSKFSDIEHVRRTQENHSFQCDALLSTSASKLKKHFSTLYGINFDSSFNTLQYFHVIGGLPPDIMHDIDEGVIPLVVSKVLLRFLNEKLFTIDELNHVIQHYDYGPAAIKDKPSLITLDHLKNANLRQSASQRRCLLIFLPMLIGARVSKASKCWELITLLITICRLLFMDSINSLEILELGSFISDFLSLFKTLFPNDNITPKMHHMVHYPMQIREYGPLNAFWCMRYEGKHSYFKQMLNIVGNFVNVPWTLACRHQQWLCNKYSMARGDLLKFENSFSKKIKMIHLQKLDYGGQVAQCFKMSHTDHFVQRLLWWKSNSLKFMVNKSIVLCNILGSPRMYTQFGRIVDILLVNDTPLFVVQMFRTKSYNDHFQSYEVESRKDLLHVVVPPHELAEFNIFSVQKPAFKRLPNSTIMLVLSKVKVQGVYNFIDLQ